MFSVADTLARVIPVRSGAVAMTLAGKNAHYCSSLLTLPACALLPKIATGVLSTLTVNADRMQAALSFDMLATDIAYYLVRRKVRPCLSAHAVGGPTSSRWRADPEPTPDSSPPHFLGPFPRGTCSFGHGCCHGRETRRSE